jgi:hypothetical protein
MKKILFVLLLLATVQASQAGDVRISARSTVSTNPPSSQEVSWWDTFCDWLF